MTTEKIKKIKKILSIVAISAIGAAILFFICLLASCMFGENKKIFDNEISLRILVNLLIVGSASALLITAIQGMKDYKIFAGIEALILIVTSLLAIVLFSSKLNQNATFVKTVLCFVVVSVALDVIVGIEQKALGQLKTLRAVTYIPLLIVAVLLLLTILSVVTSLWKSTLFVFVFVVLCLAFLGLWIAVTVMSKSVSKEEKTTETKVEKVTISKEEYDRLLEIEKEYNKLKNNG